jgi:hypothetical protein
LYGATPASPKPIQLEKYDFEIVNETQIPRDFLMPNEKALWKVISQFGPAAAIPGVRIFDHANNSDECCHENPTRNPLRRVWNACGARGNGSVARLLMWMKSEREETFFALFKEGQIAN